MCLLFVHNLLFPHPSPPPSFDYPNISVSEQDMLRCPQCVLIFHPVVTHSCILLNHRPIARKYSGYKNQRINTPNNT